MTLHVPDRREASIAGKRPKVTKEAGKYEAMRERISGVSTAQIERSLHSSCRFWELAHWT
eukprot:CAMPEP_0181028086 /NCGR_PEP_ID=MMETSP1070-20121207/4490_1 /TAXON_ID=265543 /ORGANISM="Minutocellus polymorphus, Strain NH13" /LENGTH=59 /DNA_ID=CAMNT_0023105331 /DNA_START=615 /DNA_END=794 /DNA_ORIENTATION=+